MKKQTLFVFLILLLFCLACGSNADTETTADLDKTATVGTTASARDSLQELYQQFLAARKDSLPIKQIQEVGKVYPVDEAPKDVSFYVFRSQLQEAIEKREVFALMDIIHPEVKVDFGGAGGVADFVTVWELDTPEKAKQSRVWDLLKKILKNGGKFSDGGKRFLAPYTYAGWPDEEDMFEHVAITGSGVRVRSSPSLQSRTITMVSYDIVKFIEKTPIEETIGGETHPWVKIQLEEGKEAYVYGSFVASPIDFRASFERQADGKWLMTFLVAGD